MIVRKINTFLGLLWLFLLPNLIIGQDYADRNYYLIDSLLIHKIGGKEKKLIDSALHIYHRAKNDTSKIKAINIIVEKSWDDTIWPRYNDWVHDYLEKEIAKGKSNKKKQKNY